MTQALAEADAVKHRARELLGTCVAGKLQRKHYVFQCGHGRKELKRLKNEAHHPRPQGGAAVLVEIEEIVTVEAHAALGRRVETGDEAEQR